MSIEFKLPFRGDYGNDFQGRKEQLIAEKAFADFMHIPSFQLHRTDIPEENHVAAEILQFNPNTRTTGNAYLDFLISELPKKSGPSEYNIPNLFDKDRMSRILLLRKEKPPDELIGAILAHADQFHHGNVPFTEMQLANQNKRRCNGANSTHHTDAITEEEISMNNILQMTGNTIRFYPLTNKDGVVKIFEELNKISDEYETEYAINLAVRNITDSRNRLAATGIPAGLLLEQGLEHIPSDFVAKWSSQIMGEVMAMFVTAAPKIFADWQSQKSDVKNIRQFLKLLNNLAKDFLNGQRALTLLATLSTTGVLTFISEQQHSILPYALIPFLNTLMITLIEAKLRSDDYRSASLTGEQKEQIQTQLPRILRYAVNVVPEKYRDKWALAAVDMEMDPYTWGTLIGSFTASCATPALEALGLPKDWIYALSGMIIESTIATGYGLAKQRDPYKIFLNKYEKLNKSKEKTS